MLVYIIYVQQVHILTSSGLYIGPEVAEFGSIVSLTLGQRDLLQLVWMSEHQGLESLNHLNLMEAGPSRNQIAIASSSDQHVDGLCSHLKV